MTDDSHHAMILRAGANPALVPSGSPLVARALSELAPAKRRVLIVEDNVGHCKLLCDAVRAAGCLPLVAQEWSRASDLTNGLPFEVVILMGKSLEFLKEARASFPLEVPIVYGMRGKVADGERRPLPDGERGNHYQRAIDSGAAFIFLDDMASRRSAAEVLSDALVLARFLRDHPEECGWPAPPPEDPDVYRVLIVDMSGHGGPMAELLPGYRTQVIRDPGEGLRQIEQDPPDILWTGQSSRHHTYLDGIRARIQGHVPTLVSSCAGSCCDDVWPLQAATAFRWMSSRLLPLWHVVRACHDAVRLRRAFRYAEAWVDARALPSLPRPGLPS